MARGEYLFTLLCWHVNRLLISLKIWRASAELQA